MNWDRFRGLTPYSNEPIHTRQYRRRYCNQTQSDAAHHMAQIYASAKLTRKYNFPICATCGTAKIFDVVAMHHFCPLEHDAARNHN